MIWMTFFPALSSCRLGSSGFSEGMAEKWISSPFSPILSFHFLGGPGPKSSLTSFLLNGLTSGIDRDLAEGAFLLFLFSTDEASGAFLYRTSLSTLAFHSRQDSLAEESSEEEMTSCCRCCFLENLVKELLVACPGLTK